MNIERTARESRAIDVHPTSAWPKHCISNNKTPGFVYFVQAETGGLVKIGWATKPAARVANMQMVCPVRLALLFATAGNGARMDSFKRASIPHPTEPV